MKQVKYRCNGWKKCRKGRKVIRVGISVLRTRCNRWFARTKDQVCGCESLWVFCHHAGCRVRTEKTRPVKQTVEQWVSRELRGLDAVERAGRKCRMQFD